MARHSDPEYALGHVLQLIRPSIALGSMTDRAFMMEFFDAITDPKLIPGNVISKGESSENTILGGVFAGIDKRDLNKLYKGKRKLPRRIADRMLTAISTKRICALWNNTSTREAIIELGNSLRVEGGKIETGIDVPVAVAKILKEVIRANAQGYDLLMDVDQSKDLVLPGVKSYSLTTARVSGNKLIFDESAIKISAAPPVPAAPTDDEVYVLRAMEAYADHLHRSVVPPSQVASFGKMYELHLARQRSNYWAAVGRQRNVREICQDDGEERFERIKDDLEEGVTNTWINPHYKDAYDRMLNTLQKAADYNLKGDALTSIPELFGAREKQGMTHMLVNEDRVRWTLE